LAEGRSVATLQQRVRVEYSEQLDQLRHHPGPARLMAGTQARAVIAGLEYCFATTIVPVERSVSKHMSSA
jgi:hypothetical protein